MLRTVKRGIQGLTSLRVRVLTYNVQAVKDKERQEHILKEIKSKRNTQEIGLQGTMRRHRDRDQYRVRANMHTKPEDQDGCILQRWHEGEGGATNLLDPLGKGYYKQIWRRAPPRTWHFATGFTQGRRREQGILQARVVQHRLIQKGKGYISSSYDVSNAFPSMAHSVLDGVIDYKFADDKKNADILKTRYREAYMYVQTETGGAVLGKMRAGGMQGDSIKQRMAMNTYTRPEDQDECILQRWHERDGGATFRRWDGGRSRLDHTIIPKDMLQKAVKVVILYASAHSLQLVKCTQLREHQHLALQEIYCVCFDEGEKKRGVGLDANKKDDTDQDEKCGVG